MKNQDIKGSFTLGLQFKNRWGYFNLWLIKFEYVDEHLSKLLPYALYNSFFINFEWLISQCHNTF